MRIEGVQSSTAGDIAEIEKVSSIVNEVSEIVSSIAAAIEQQATAQTTSRETSQMHPAVSRTRIKE